MSTDTKIGLGMVGLLAVCCGLPLIATLFASGVLLGAVGSVWAHGQLLFTVGAALLISTGLWLLVRRRGTHAADDATCCAPPVVSTRSQDQAK
jgi:hypothetical protein